tara:strand:+ start:86 stop:256 length:171 start_codon:yes stop_codon:yes gene_type:complete
MPTEVTQIMEKLNHIQSDLDYIKGHISDVDFVLTDDDLNALAEAEEDLSTGKTIKL